MYNKAKGLVYAGALMLPLASMAGSYDDMTLEERVAELERQVQILHDEKGPGTITHPGYPNVSLSLDGVVNVVGLGGWNDDDNEFLGFVNNDSESSRFTLRARTGSWNGYTFGGVLQFVADFDNSGFETDGVEQSDSSEDDVYVEFDEDARASFDVEPERAYFWAETPMMGGMMKIILGLTDMATNRMTEVDLSGTKETILHPDPGRIGAGLNFHDGGDTGNTPIVGDVFWNHDGWRTTLARASFDFGDSLEGLNLQVSAARNGNWDAALRFARKFNGMMVAMAAGYIFDTAGIIDDDEDFDREIMGGSIAVRSPEGWNGAFGIGSSDQNDDDGEDTTHFWVKLGKICEIFDFGSTAFAIDWHQSQDIIDDEDDSNAYRAGVVQNIDEFGMQMYAGVHWFTHDQNDNNHDDLVVGAAGARLIF